MPLIIASLSHAHVVFLLLAAFIPLWLHIWTLEIKLLTPLLPPAHPLLAQHHYATAPSDIHSADHDASILLCKSSVQTPC